MEETRNSKIRKTVIEYLLITFGTLLLIAGNYIFKFPNHFTFGGVSGIATLLNGITGWSTSTVNLILNIALLVVSFFTLGKDFGMKSVYASLLFSFGISACDIIYPMEKPLTNEPVLELFFAILVPAFGSAILFNLNASSGGTDIIALIVKKYYKTELGTALFLADSVIVVSTFFVYGIETGLYSVIGLIAKSLVIDLVIENINRSKYFTIICDDPEPILDYIKNDLNRSATVYNAQGAYSGDRKTVILTVTKRSQAIDLRNYIKKVEPRCFITITTTSEIIGKGFRGFD